MPTYDYICDACQHEMELFQNISEEPIKKCPECGKKKLRRLFGTGGGIIFKGSGFYTTDYRSDSYRKSAASDSSSSSSASSGAEGKSEGKSESKGETKPEAKSESKPSESKPSDSGGKRKSKDK